MDVNHETIEMYDEEGGEYRFEKVALINSDEEKKSCAVQDFFVNAFVSRR